MGLPRGVAGPVFRTPLALDHKPTRARASPTRARAHELGSTLAARQGDFILSHERRIERCSGVICSAFLQPGDAASDGRPTQLDAATTRRRSRLLPLQPLPRSEGSGGNSAEDHLHLAALVRRRPISPGHASNLARGGNGRGSNHAARFADFPRPPETLRSSHAPAGWPCGTCPPGR
jgi:hypothetical protein